MKGFRLSPEAARDIREIWAYIAEDNIKAARRVRLKILHACQGIAENPKIGHRREDLTEKPGALLAGGLLHNHIQSSAATNRDCSRRAWCARRSKSVVALPISA